MNFVQIPNLPESDTTLVAVSDTYHEVTNALEALGINVISIRPYRKLSKPVSSHADLLLHHLGGNKIIVADGEVYLKEELHQFGFETIQSNICISDVYPHDVALDAARVGHYLFAKETALDTAIKQYCAENQIQIIPVRQGYAKCSIAVVNEHSIITADESIVEAAQAIGIDVLKIMPGHIQLKGYNYGFLGGASGLISKNKLAFTGSIQTHPDYEKIKSFCSRKNVELISLTNGPLIDIGGILPLKIKNDK